MPFKKGESGNPKGVAHNRPFWAALTRICIQEDYKRIYKAAHQLLDKAAEGEAWAIQALADRTDGRPTVKAEVDVSAPSLVEVLARLSGGAIGSASGSVGSDAGGGNDD